MRKLVLLITTLLAIPAALADGWDMMGWGIGSFLGLIYFAILSFVFCVIFWWTYKWIVKEKKK